MKILKDLKSKAVENLKQALLFLMVDSENREKETNIGNSRVLSSK